MFLELLILDHIMNDDDETYEQKKPRSLNECNKEECEIDSIISCSHCKKTFCMKHINVDQHGCRMPTGIKKKSFWRFWD